MDRRPHLVPRRSGARNEATHRQVIEEELWSMLQPREPELDANHPVARFLDRMEGDTA